VTISRYSAVGEGESMLGSASVENSTEVSSGGKVEQGRERNNGDSREDMLRS